MTEDRAPYTVPKERPILFSAPMVRALLAGTKTQTRRVVKPPHGRGDQYPHADPFAMPPALWWWDCKHKHVGVRQDCPYGQPGDRLWVRESLRFVKVGENLHEHAVYAADGVRVRRCPDLADWCCDGLAFGLAKSVPSIHMPRWASRITLEVTAVRVERLQNISEADAMAEGISRSTFRPDDGWPLCEGYMVGPDDGTTSLATSASKAYRKLWDQINGAGSWDANPWVWVVEFKRV